MVAARETVGRGRRAESGPEPVRTAARRRGADSPEPIRDTFGRGRRAEAGSEPVRNAIGKARRVQVIDKPRCASEPSADSATDAFEL